MSERGTQTLDIAVIAGDGIGPEVVAEGLKVLEAVTGSSGAKVATTNTPKTGPTPSKVDAKPTANATKGKAANTTTNNQKPSNPSGGKTPVNKTPPKKSDKKPK